jgi:large subunit ribosomal protein L10
MRMPRPEKTEAVTDIAGRFKEADAVLLTEYRGLRVSEIAEVRNALRATGSEYRVLKNTLARIAVREVGLEELVEMLQGPTAIAFIQGDAAAAAKALDEAAKKFPVLVIKGGVLSGRIIDAEQAKELAGLEPREVQLAKIAMMLNQPAQMTVNVLSALLRDLGSMLAQVVQKKESGELPGGEPAAEAAPEPEAEATPEPVAEETPEPAAEAPSPEPGPAEGEEQVEKDEEEES